MVYEQEVTADKPGSPMLMKRTGTTAMRESGRNGSDRDGDAMEQVAIVGRIDDG